MGIFLNVKASRKQNNIKLFDMRLEAYETIISLHATSKTGSLRQLLSMLENDQKVDYELLRMAFFLMTCSKHDEYAKYDFSKFDDKTFAKLSAKCAETILCIEKLPFLFKSKSIRNLRKFALAHQSVLLQIYSLLTNDNANNRKEMKKKLIELFRQLDILNSTTTLENLKSQTKL